MNVSEITTIPDLSLRNKPLTSSISTNDKKSFRDLLASSGENGIEKKVQNSEDRNTSDVAVKETIYSAKNRIDILKDIMTLSETELGSEIGAIDINFGDVLKESKALKLSSKNENTYGFKELINKISLKNNDILTEDIDIKKPFDLESLLKNKTLKSSDTITEEKDLDENITSILGSLMNVIAAIKTEVTSESGKSEENALVNKLLDGDISISEALSNEKTPENLKKSLADLGFSKEPTKNETIFKETLSLLSSNVSDVKSQADKADGLITKIKDLLDFNSDKKNLSSLNLLTSSLNENTSIFESRQALSKAVEEVLSDSRISTDNSELSQLFSDLTESLKSNNLEETFSSKSKNIAEKIMTILSDGMFKENLDPSKLEILKTKLSDFISSKPDINENKAKEQILSKLSKIINDFKNQGNANEGNTFVAENDRKVNLLEQRANYISSKAEINFEENTYKLEDSASKENKFLNEIIGDDKEDKSFQKVIQLTNFNKTENLNSIKNELPTVSKNTVLKDVIDTFKYMEKNDLKELTVKIKPKELGEITIKLIAHGEVMKASINASSKETYDLLNSKAPEIKHMLNTQNIKIEDVSIDFNDSFQSFQFGEGNFKREERNSQNRTGFSSKNNGEKVEHEEIAEITSNLNILA